MRRTALTDKADVVLLASYHKGVDLFSIDEMGRSAEASNSSKYSRKTATIVSVLKAISGGGGKGQRIMNAPNSYCRRKRSKKRWRKPSLTVRHCCAKFSPK